MVEYEASTGNPKAIALLSPSFREVLRSRTQAAFGLPEDSLAEKQKAFQEAYEECLADNRADLEALSLPGDDLYYPQPPRLDRYRTLGGIAIGIRRAREA